MRRKLTPHGPSSMTVSLPPSWIKHNHLKKGEELEVIEEENNILIKPVTTTQDIKITEVSFVGIDKATSEDMILALHKKGYDEIKIIIDNLDMIKEIHAFLNHMQLGFEIIKQESDSVTIRNISNPEIEQFDNLFRRVFRITIEYSNKIEIIMQNKEEMTHSCILHEVSINRISNYCNRIIIKEKRKNACFFYAIIEELNNLTRNLTILLNEVMNVKNDIPKNVVSKYSEITSILIQVYELYYKFSIKEYSDIKKRLETTKKSIAKLRSKDIEETVYWDNMELIREEIQNLLDSTLAVQF
jgi:phosphate uptake regulator